jgi:CRISPR/Cas system CSM-associated protein Csm3 (group 7 of RAMP superfamily)
MRKSPQRLDIAYTLTWMGGWHVGSGYGTAIADRLVRRRALTGDGKGQPFVPGSQIKGVLRHLCERLAALFDLPVVSPHFAGPHPPDELLENFQPLQRSALLIDRLFGSRYQGDCLFVHDAMPPERSPEPSSRWHSRTAIDRVSGTAKDRTLFVTEVADGSGPKLHGRIRARHPVGVLTQLEDGFPYEYALLLAGLLSLDMLGGDKSTGLGRCRLCIDGGRVRWNERADYPVEEALAGFQDADWRGMLELVRGEASS